MIVITKEILVEECGGVMVTTKLDWEYGFQGAIEYDACDPTVALISTEAYVAGYAYAMDWLIKLQRGFKCPCWHCASRLNSFKLETLYRRQF